MWNVDLYGLTIMSMTTNRNTEIVNAPSLWTFEQPISDDEHEKICDVRAKWPCTGDMIISQKMFIRIHAKLLYNG
jgi:hypothetical protein